MSISSSRAGSSRQPIKNKMEKFTFTLGKLDAGMAILLGPNAHLLEFPSLLLPTPGPGTPPLGPGSILTITVSRDLEAEALAERSFSTLQQNILDAYTVPPTVPKLKVRSVTQTSVVLDWDKIDIGSADFRALEMWKNGQRLGRVGGEYGKKDKEKREWKTGGLQVGEEFSFHLVLKTTAGTFTSNKIKVRTHTMDNLTGINIYFGPIQPESLLGQLRSCLSEIGAKESRKLGIDTTHFVCTTPLVGGDDQGRGGAVSREYAEAVQANLPVVGPGWLMAVAGERKLVPISSHLLPPMPTNVPVADPAPFKRPEPLKRSSLPFTSSTPGSPIQEQPPRSPSPETIARMSYTSSQPPVRQDSLDATERRRSMPVEASTERRRGREATYPLDAPRPRSPKPEADGKLDRGFVFPVVSPTSPTTAEASTPPEATEPASVPVEGKAEAANGETAAGGPIAAVEEENEPSQIAGAIPIDIPATIIPSTIFAEPNPVTTPPATSAASEPAEKVRASTIDEAISNFHDAVKTQPTSPVPEQPRTPTIALNGTPIEDGFDQVDLALEAEANDRRVEELGEGLEAVDLEDETATSSVNGDTPGEVESGAVTEGEGSTVEVGNGDKAETNGAVNGSVKEVKTEVKTGGGKGKKGKGKKGKGGR